METSRRKFIRQTLTGVAGTTIVPNYLFSKDSWERGKSSKKTISQNDKIRLAAIGMGIQGFSNCDAALKLPDAELVAVCDLYTGRLTRCKEMYGDHLDTTKEYREILQRDDIDAVIISVTDHWHDHMAIAALESGKAVYCEKPMVHHIREGKAIIKAEAESGKPFQVGSQRVSSELYKKGSELYFAGEIGELVLVETYYDRQSALGAWQYSIPVDASPKTVDWERFIGDAPKHSFDPVRFFRWRNYSDYGTGVAGDLFVHLYSGLHVLLKSNGPNRIYASGGIRYWKDGRNAADVMIAVVDYPETQNHPAFNLQIRVNFVDGAGGGSILRLVGTEGVMTMGWNNIKIKKSKMSPYPGYGGWDSYNTFSEEGRKEYEKWYKSEFPGEKPTVREPEKVAFQLPVGYSDHVEHYRVFFNAMRGEGKIVEDASFGLRAAAPSLAANMSLAEGKPIDWDPDEMKIL